MFSLQERHHSSLCLKNNKGYQKIQKKQQILIQQLQNYKQKKLSY